MTAFTLQRVPVAVDAESVLVLTQLEDPHDQNVIATTSDL